MKIYIVLIIIAALNIMMLQGMDSEYILKNLEEETGWMDFKQKGNTTIRRKSIEGFDLYALEIIRNISIDPDKVFSVLLNVSDYKQVLGDNKYLEAEEVKNEPDQLTGYQYARLPLIPNRHYIFSFDLKDFRSTAGEENRQLSWILINPEGGYSGFLEKKNSENRNPIYINNGAGLWTVKKLSEIEYQNSYRLYLDPAGWMPGWLVNSFNVKNLEQLFDKVLVAAGK